MGNHKVKLNCRWDDGEKVQQPGALVEMDYDKAMGLADMGLVELVKEKEETKPPQPSTATKAKPKAATKGKAVAKKAKRAKTIEEALTDNDLNDEDDVFDVSGSENCQSENASGDEPGDLVA